MPRSNAREDGTAVERDLDRLDSVNKGLAAALNAQRGETPLAAAKSQPRRPRKKAQGGEAQGGTAPDRTATTTAAHAATAAPTSAPPEEPLDLIQRLQRQGDTYTRKIETEKRLIANLRNNLNLLQTKVDQQRQQMGGIGGAERKQRDVMRRLQQMENRLDNALIKYNRRVAENRDLRAEIDGCRRQRLVYDNIYAGLEQELAQKKKAMTKIIPRTEGAVQKQDRLRQQMSRLRLQIEQEQKEFDQKWSELGAEIAIGRQAHSIKLRKELEERGDEDGSAEGGDGGFNASGGGDGSGANHAGSGNGATIEQQTKRKLARGAWAIAKEKAQIHMSAEKIQAYEVAFEKIREITGISDIEVLVDRFIEAEERNFSTFKYISHLNKELEKLDTQIHEARSEIERFRGQGVETDSQRKKILRDLESKLHRTEMRTREFDERHTRVAQVLAMVKKRVQEIFHRIGCRNTIAASFVGNQGVTDSNLMQHLGIIEQRTNEVLQMYAASGAAFNDDAPAEPSANAGSASSAGTNANGVGAASSAAAVVSSVANSKHSALLSAKRHSQQHRLSLGVGPRQASGSHTLQVSPPGMEEMDTSGAALMVDDSDRPMARVEILRMIKANGDQDPQVSNMGGTRRPRRS